MKFKINSEVLLKGLNTTAKAVPATSSIAALTYILFDLKGDLLRITGSDSENTIRTVLKTSEGLEDGTVCVSASYLINLLKTLSKCELTVAYDPEKTTIYCSWGTGNSVLPVCKASDYPSIRMPAKDAETIKFNGTSIHEALSNAVNYTATDSNRPAMTGIFFDIDKDRTNIVATDGHKLAVFTNEEMKSSRKTSAILSRKTATKLQSLIEKDGEVIMKFDSKCVKFKIGNTELISSLIANKYPDYNCIIPNNDKNILEIDKDSFLETVKRVSTCADKISTCLKFKIDDKNITVSGTDTKLSLSAKEKIACDYSGKSMTIGFRSLAFITILESIKGKYIRLHLGENNTRAVLVVPSDKNEDKEAYKGVIMPIAV